MSGERDESVVIPGAERLYQEAQKGYHKVVLPYKTSSFLHNILMEVRMGAERNQKDDQIVEKRQLDRVTDAFYVPDVADGDRNSRAILLRFDSIGFLPRFILGQIEVGRFDREELIRALDDFRRGIQRLGFDFGDNFAGEVERSTFSARSEGSVG